MEDKIINKLFNKVKDKFTKQKQNNYNIYEYTFSDEEIESINKQNKQKILELKQGMTLKSKQDKTKPNTLEVLSKLEEEKEITEPSSKLEEKKDEEPPIEEPKEENSIEIQENKKEDPEESQETKTSFINLNKEHQNLVMTKWKEINLTKIDKDIIDAKDLFNHNYASYYAKESMKFIEYIRREYEVVICYLIGFNNEKQGIMNKTIFADSFDEEWKHLNSYIKILEKIRKNR